jgi:glutamate-ammonia-ligase adenylyltransferase
MTEESKFKGPLYDLLKDRLQNYTDLEEKIDELRKFKRERIKVIEASVSSPRFDLEKAMNALTDLADAVLIVTYEMAKEAVRKIYGLPRFKDNDGNYLPGEFALIGMGKLGGKELHFSSDLDVIFIFNRNGETYGRRVCTNREFYAKVTQRMISYLTLYTRFGYAYKVDTELRPSGRAGALVTALDPWITYYHENAALWEKQALLKARLICATGDFAVEFSDLFKRLIFSTPFPENLGNKIHHLRMRMEKELAKESETYWNYKKGYGGLVDIEFTIQYFQLKMGKIFDDLLSANTTRAMTALGNHAILRKGDLETLRKGYDFYRRLEIHLELQFNLREGYLDIKGEFVPELARRMGFPKSEDFMEKFTFFRREIRKIYLDSLKIKET